MIYQCSETFTQSYLALNVDQQAQVLLALRNFRHTPRMPTRDAHIIRDDDPARTDDDVWAIALPNGGHITYSYLPNAHPDHVVCFLRQAAFTD